ncbi:MAG: hypothetical protein Q7L55_04870 [Actinomycetota bacterium]|nr:hypothetical protein [Actinomycetota bacterium]
MNRLKIPAILTAGLLAAVLVAPSALAASANPSPPPASPAGSKPSNTVQGPAAPGSAGPLLAEAQQVFQTMTQTQYTHKYTINPTGGIYYWDCVGFTNWALKQATPNAYAAFHTQMNVPTNASGHVALWAQFLKGTPGPAWNAVPTVASLTGGELMIIPGEILLNGQVQYGSVKGGVSYPGHAVIIAGPPLMLSDGSYAVFVYDSTAVPGHGQYDSRYTDPRALPMAGTTNKYSGTGYGTMRLTVNSTGAPAAVYWSAANKSPIMFHNQVVVPVLARPLN